MMRDISLKAMLVMGFLVAGLIPLMIVSLVSLSTARSEMQQQAFRQLEAVRNIKKEQVRAFFQRSIDELEVLVRDPHVGQACEALDDAYRQGGGSEGGRFAGLLEQGYQAPQAYRDVHDRYYPFFRTVVDRFGYYDLFLISPGTGDTLFTVRKESDFGIRIGTGASSLREVWRVAGAQRRTALSDTKPYAPSRDLPAQFLAAPIREQERLLGVLAIQISIDSIDNIMRERSGMWRSGETYLVGSDFRMRSDSHLDPDAHSVKASFAGTLAENGVDSIPVRLALNGETGAMVTSGYQKKDVLSAYTPVDLSGIRWAMIAEVDKAEIDSQIARALNARIVVVFLVSLLILILLSWLVSGFFNRGISSTTAQLDGMIRSVLQGQLNVRGNPDQVGTDFRAVVLSANQLIDAFVLQMEEKQRLEEHLRFDERMRAIGTLAGGIAHDFNNILTSLFTFSHIVISELPADHPVQEQMQEILRSLRRAGEMVEQILTFGRSTSSEKQMVALNGLVGEALKLFGATVPGRIRVEGSIPSDLMYVRILPSQIHQILLNLFVNAQYAMTKSGGTIRVALTRSSGGDTQGEAPAAMYAVLAVRDTGPGMSAAVQARIFEPFFTTKPPGEGSGMGLSIVHGIVLNAGGYIEVESEPGEGTLFKVHLPLANPTALAMEPERPDICPGGAGEHVLVIDDEVSVCIAQKTCLESRGFRVTTLSDPRKVEGVMRRGCPEVDLVVTDWHMPHLNGREVAEQIHRFRPHLPIVLTSGVLAEGDGQIGADLEEIGVAAFLRKPCEPDHLVAVVCRVLKNARGRAGDEGAPG